ncbi:MCE family protein [Jatrophihabitans sp.]|uniref:MCE family protein n=1 Tax=Jatrophihabitans sp. TaxID=1932789 RepID=UPI0030C69852
MSRWTRPLITTLVLVIVAAGGVFWWHSSHRDGIHFSAAFIGTVGVYPGSGVRILGVPVGEVDSVRPAGTEVIVTMHLDHGVSVRADTEAAIVSPNLVSDRYVQLTGVYTGGPKLAAGARIPLDRTATPVEIDQLYKSLVQVTTALGPKGANSKGALSDFLRTSAANLTGNGTDFNKTITALSKASTTLNGSQKDFFATVDNLESFTANLAKNNSALSSVNTSLASVSQVLADDRQTFGEALNELGKALGVVQSFIRDNRAALTTDVDKLAVFAKNLAGEQSELAAALKTAPLLTQNFANAYDAKDNVLLGRGDLNELSVWAANGTTSSSARSSSSSSSTAPPTLLPGVGS